MPCTDATLFVGSSVEGLDVAYALQEGLEFDVEATVWSQGIFAPSQPTLASLLAALGGFQFAAFVFTPDDLLTLRGAKNAAVRDNVLFEFGLFVGKLGLERCFYMMPSKADDFRLPTDLVGTTALTYKAERKDGNLVAALGPACNKIRRAIRIQTQVDARSLEHLLASWNGRELSGARDRLRQGIDSDPRGHDADDRKAIQRVFAFLESLADGILAGAVPEAAARVKFEAAVLAFWPTAATWLAPPDHVEDWWQPPPKLAQLHARWSEPDT